MESGTLKYGLIIMKNNRHITRSELEKLIKNDADSNNLELDDFEKEALEGWKSSGASISQMKHMDKVAAAKFGGTAFSTFFFAGMAITIAAIVSIYYFSQTEENITKPGKQQMAIETTEITLPEKIDTLTELKKEVQLLPKEIIQKNKEEQKTTSSTPSETLAFIETMDISLEPLPANIEDREVSISKQKVAKERYPFGIKAIDYSEYRTNPEVKIEQTILTGLPANYETQEEMETEAKTKTILVGYTDYLDKTLSYIQKSKWKNALARCEEILSDYPDDINALFYSGFCLYNLQQYDQACSKFSACLQLNFSNFNEEASWYLAKSRLANGEKSLAKELFIGIKENKGYYYKDAEKILKDWK
jgi:TolA-binding protein